MSTSSAAPPGAAVAGTRWLRVVKIAAWISIVLIGLFLTVVTVGLWREMGGTAGAPYLVFLALTLAPYILILLWLRGRPQRKGLALAGMAGWGGLAGAGIGGLTIGGDVPAALLLSLPQVLLLVGTYRAHAGMRQLTGDKRKLTEGVRWSYLGLLSFLGFFSLCVSPGEIHTRVAANQASAVGALRTINTAEITYADTYKSGYSPSLAALAPPPAGAQPSASAAGLIDDVLARGVKNGYRFTYTPGPPDKDGHIQTYTVSARPLEFGKSGRNSYFTNQTAVIRQATEDRPASEKDPAIGG